MLRVMPMQNPQNKIEFKSQRRNNRTDLSFGMNLNVSNNFPQKTTLSRGNRLVNWLKHIFRGKNKISGFTQNIEPATKDIKGDNVSPKAFSNFNINGVGAGTALPDTATTQMRIAVENSSRRTRRKMTKW